MKLLIDVVEVENVGLEEWKKGREVQRKMVEVIAGLYDFRFWEGGVYFGANRGRYSRVVLFP